MITQLTLAKNSPPVTDTVLPPSANTSTRLPTLTSIVAVNEEIALYADISIVRLDQTINQLTFFDRLQCAYNI